MSTLGDLLPTKLRPEKRATIVVECNNATRTRGCNKIQKYKIENRKWKWKCIKKIEWK